MAIDDPLDEQEQSERVRNWLKSNGLGLFGGVALGLGLIFGWQWWQKNQLQQSVQANIEYRAVLDSLDGGDLDKAQAALAQLKGGKANIYVDLAALRLAQAQASAGKPEVAIATLRAIKAEPSLQPLVTLRLAKLLTSAGKPADAVALLGDAVDSASLEAKGDAYAALAKPEQAREMYLKALTGMDVAAPQRRLVELKLTGAGGTPPKPAQPI